MRKVYLIETIFIIWLVIVLSLFFPVYVKADNGEGIKPMVAFTFDDGPNPIYTKKLLDGLAERNAKATFFVVGERLDYKSGKYEDWEIAKGRELVARMAREGHTVANHSYSHCWLSKSTHEKVDYELKKTNELIKEITGQETKYMRPPGGSALTAPWVRNIAAPMITVSVFIAFIVFAADFARLRVAVEGRFVPRQTPIGQPALFLRPDVKRRRQLIAPLDRRRRDKLRNLENARFFAVRAVDRQIRQFAVRRSQVDADDVFRRRRATAKLRVFFRIVAALIHRRSLSHSVARFSPRKRKSPILSLLLI